MPSNVYFQPVVPHQDPGAIETGLRRLLVESGMPGCVDKGDDAVVKMHFGEEGNTGHVAPRYVAVIADLLRLKAASITVSDSNTLYHGRRMVSADHEQLAREHGFDPGKLGANLLVPDETKKELCTSVKVKGRYIKDAKLLRLYKEAQPLVSVAHFKGHMVAGFGGAIKNVGMGCASREGKLAQHSTVTPQVNAKRCTGCAACKAVCPVAAIAIVNGISLIDKSACVGCASCIAACAYGAMNVNWKSGRDNLIERMVEYAAAVLLPAKKAFYINFALSITAECDCEAKDDPRIVDDVGIFASTDPVAIDQASFDAVKEKAGGANVFLAAHPGRDGLRQLAYAEKLGLGSRSYRLIKV